MRRKVSLYDIPEGCVCVGDGLYGMRCDTEKHAKCRHCKAPHNWGNRIADLERQLAVAREALEDIACCEISIHVCRKTARKALAQLDAGTGKEKPSDRN